MLELITLEMSKKKNQSDGFLAWPNPDGTSFFKSWLGLGFSKKNRTRFGESQDFTLQKIDPICIYINIFMY